MPEPAVERPMFYALSVWQVVAFYLLSAAALAVFFYGAYRRLRRYRLGRPDTEERLTLKSLSRAAADIVFNRAIFRGDGFAGLAHLLVFWGFGGLFIATLIVLVENDLVRILIPAWSFLKGDFYLGFSWAADLFGLLLLAGLVMLALRRWLFRPPQFDYAPREEAANFPSPLSMVREDRLLLLLLLAVVIGGFAAEAFRIRATQLAFERVSFVGWGLSQWLAGLGVSRQMAEGTARYTWFFHALTALALVACIPYTKAWHMLAGWYSAALKPPVGRAALPAPTQREGGGYAALEDLTRRELVMVDACTRCGRCHVACPVANAGFPLSPRDLILVLRSHIETAAFAHRRAAAPADPANSPSLAGELVPGAWLWSCTTCLSCDDVCPLGVRRVPLVVQMRRHLVFRGEVDTRLQAALTNLGRYGNSFGTSPRARARWTQGLDSKIKDARKEPVEYLWFVGDYASFDPRLQPVTRAAARVFQHAGLDFGILYEGEQNSGNDARRAGEEGLFEMLVEKNRQAFARACFERMLTTDPHSYQALKREYGENGKIVHYTEVLDRLTQDGKLAVQGGLNLNATYHDPCYLGRYNGIYDAPRRVLRKLGVNLVEMPRNRADSYCCGAGGGRIWMEDRPGIKERPAESRVREAAGLPGVNTLVVSCPKDLVMFQDAVKTARLEDKLVVRDLAELVEQACCPSKERSDGKTAPRQ